jgi:hypothetical protein
MQPTFSHHLSLRSILILSSHKFQRIALIFSNSENTNLVLSEFCFKLKYKYTGLAKSVNILLINGYNVEYKWMKLNCLRVESNGGRF